MAEVVREQLYDIMARRRIFLFVVFGVFASYSIRLGYLQLIQGNVYRVKAETQAIKEVTVAPFRGNIFDRKNEIIVHNSPSFSITLTPNEFHEASIPLLCTILKMDTSEIYTLYREAKRFSQAKPYKIYRDADMEIVAAIEENKDWMPGIEVAVESKRLYHDDCHMAHTLGYAREITEAQLQKKGDYYQKGDIIGTTGLESTYEEFLRGTKGVEFVAVNAAGQRVESFRDGNNDLLSEEGFDLYLGIDKRLQTLAEKLLEGRRGAVAAINPNNGEVLALASKPDFELKSFSGRVPKELYTKLSTDEANPLFNRATLTRYPPGSTFKMFLGLVGLQEGIITPSTTLHCAGGYTYGGRTWKCHGGVHGNINLQRAIHVSCNAYFNQLAQRIGIDKFSYYGKQFGFGEKTNIDIPEDSRGLLPDRAYFKKRKLSDKEIIGRLTNLGIGQGELGVTPLQMAVYCASLANKGTIYQPHIVSKIYNRKLKKMQMQSYGEKKVDIDERWFDIVRQGMYDVVNTPGGTAASVKLPDVVVCGKTGTAQNPHGKDHSWFICFAPMDKPQIAMCVMVENAGFGGTVAAPIAREILDLYFHPNKEIPVNSPFDSTKFEKPKKEDSAQKPSKPAQTPLRTTAYREAILRRN